MSVAGVTDLLAGRYRLEQRVASGGFGEVWRATDMVLGRPVAVKLLRAEISADPEALARFHGEARHAGALAHENIARVYDYCEPGPEHPAFLVMEFVNGTSLSEVLAGGPLAPSRVMEVVAQCAAGLAAAHQAGLVHRDIKPANVLIGDDGLVKLTDFGISHAVTAAPVTATGTLLGTPAYLAPERVQGARATAAGDLYSLGVVAYQCLAGRTPFSGPAVEVALAHRLRALPPLPASVPAEVAALVGCLTAKDPGARPASAGEVARRASELRDRLAPGDTHDGRHAPPAPGPAAEPATGGPTRPWDMPRRGRSRRRRLLAATAAILSVVAAVLVASLLSQGTERNAAAAPPTSTLVQVDGQALRGRPVAEVRRLLRHLGLAVRVRWRPSAWLPPGRVLSVRPDGLVHSGTTVVVTAALAPAAAGAPGSGSTVSRSGPGSRHRHQARPARTPQPGPTADPGPTSSPVPTGNPSPTPSGGPTPGTPAP